MSKFFKVKTEREREREQWLFSNTVKGGLTVLISVLVICGVAYSGTITPPGGTPSAQFYTLSEIYNFITSNTTATEGDHDFNFSDSLTGTGRTLTEIYNALAGLISADKVKLGTTYLGTAGTLVPSGGTATTSDVLSGKTYFGDSQTNWTLQTGTYNATGLSAGTVKSGVSFGVASIGDYPSATFPLPGATATTDLAGNGVSITSANGVVEWWQSDGTRKTATLDFPSPGNVCSNVTVNNSAGTLSIAADSVGVGNTYCGTAGALLKDEFNGTRTTNSATWPGGTQQFGGVEDFNANGSGVGTAPPSDRYAKTWTQCTSGNSYCGTGDAGADWKDNSTNLIWSKTINGSTYALDGSNGTVNWLIANNCNEVSGNSCTKKTSSKTGCEANSGWFLPHQKQFMQAYIDGAYGIMEPTGLSAGSTRTYWSATTLSNNLSNAWSPNLSTGNISGTAKTGSLHIRCVR